MDVDVNMAAHTIVFTNTSADTVVDGIDRDALVPTSISSMIRDSTKLYKSEFVLASTAAPALASTSAALPGRWFPVTPRMCARVFDDTHVNVLAMYDDALVHRQCRGVFIAVDRWWPLVALAPLSAGVDVATLPELSTFTDFSTDGWPDYYAVTSASMAPWQLRMLHAEVPVDTLLVWVVYARAAPTRAEYAAAFTSVSVHAHQRCYRVRVRGQIHGASTGTPVLRAAKNALVYADATGTTVYTWRAGVIARSVVAACERDCIHVTPMFDCLIVSVSGVIVANSAAIGPRRGRNGIVYQNTYTLAEIASNNGAGTSKFVWERRRYAYIAAAFTTGRGVDAWDPRCGYDASAPEQRLLAPRAPSAVAECAPATGRELIVYPAYTQYCGRTLAVDTFVMTSPVKPRISA